MYELAVSTKILECINYVMIWESVQLDEGDHEKDLGVWFTSDLKPSLYCCKVAASATKVLSMIRRSFVKYFKKFICILVHNICKTTSGILCTYLESLSCKRH